MMQRDDVRPRGWAARRAAPRGCTTTSPRRRQCDPGFRKEYHVFDGLDLPSEAWMRRRVVARAAKAVDALERGAPANADALRQAAFYADPETYFDYFTGLLARDGIRLTCDITPSYALLPAARLAAIREGFAAPRRAARAGVLDARPGRADLVDGADEPAAPARASSRARPRTGWPGSSPATTTRRGPATTSPWRRSTRRSHRASRGWGSTSGSSTPTSSPTCAPASASTSTPPTWTTSSTPHPRARRFRTPWWRGSPGTTAGCTTRSPRGSRTSTSARCGRAAVRLRSI